MVKKPDVLTLKKLYPNINVDYLSSNIDRKLMLIKAEDEIINQLNMVMEEFKNQIFILASMAYDTSVLIAEKLKDLEFQIVNIEVDSIIHMHELSGYSFEWLIDRFYIASDETGGEQTASNVSVSRKNLVRQDISEMIQKTVSRGMNVSSVTQATLNSLQGDIGRFKSDDNSARYIPIKSAFDKASKELEITTRSVIQQSVYDAERDVNINVSNGYDIVYYRVEVLDSHICMNCMAVDGSINNKPLGLLHRNCRGIDVVLLRDVETGKYYDMDLNGYGHKLKTKSFESKFNSLSEKQKQRMLGKSNYDLFKSGKLNIDDFLVNGRSVTNTEANIIAQLKSEVDTPRKATNLVKYMDGMFRKPLSKMSNEELLAYEKCLAIQKRMYENVPNKAYGKKTRDMYISEIDAKYDALNKIRKGAK